MDDLRTACAHVAEHPTHVTVDEGAIAVYTHEVVRSGIAAQSSADAPLEDRAAAVLTLDAINFGSGWFPTLRKRDGLSGYNTIAAAWREQPTPTAPALTQIDAPTVARLLGQDPGHELMGLYAASLRDLAVHVVAEHDGSFAALAAAPRRRSSSRAGWAHGRASPTRHATATSRSPSSSAPRSPRPI